MAHNEYTKEQLGQKVTPKIEGSCSGLMEHILEDHGHTLLHRNEDAWPSYTEYRKGISEKVQELADPSDSSAGSPRVLTGTGLGPKNTICTGILLARAWYMAQIFPPLKDNLRQMNMIISWSVWKGEIFRVQLSTLQRAKKVGGWGMIHPAAKCMALFFHCMREQGQKNGTVTADWTQGWGLQDHTKNPPYAGRTPKILENLHQYDMESAYLGPRGRDETTQPYKNAYT